MDIKKGFKFATCMALALLLSHCANELDKSIEKAGFLMDDRRYTDTINLLTPVVAAHPESAEAALILATAQIGAAALGDGNSFVGKLADLLADPDANQTAYGTFSRLAPASTSDIAVLNTATDSLVALTTSSTIPDASFLREVYFDLFLARLFEIASAVAVVGAGSPDLVCNADPTGFPNFKDGIPDDFDPVAVGNVDSVRLNDNLHSVVSDGLSAGLPSGFTLNTRIDSISQDFDNAATLTNFFKDAFNDDGTGTALCIIPK